MKWFKHETDAPDSEKLKSLKSQFGWDGLGRYWRLMEIVAGKMDETDRHHYEQSEADWRIALGLKSKSLRTFLDGLDDIFEINIIWTRKTIRIEIPKLLEKRDNYTNNLNTKPGANQKILPLRFGRQSL